MNKPVIVYTGGPGSGKSYQATMYARTRGILYTAVRWVVIKAHILCGHPEKVLEFVNNNHLFVDEYDINDEESNKWIHQLQRTFNIKVLICSQAQPVVDLPESFIAITCDIRLKGVAHG